MTAALLAHLWQALFAIRHRDYLHAEEHLLAAINLVNPSQGSNLIPLEPCLLTGQNHARQPVPGARDA